MAYDKNPHCKVPDHGQHEWTTLKGLVINSCEIMCGICGKEFNDAATLRKHTKTHLKEGESITPSKRKGGPMSNREKRELAELPDQSPTRKKGRMYDPTRAFVVSDDEDDMTTAWKGVQARVQDAIKIKKEFLENEPPVIAKPNTAADPVIISDDEEEAN